MTATISLGTYGRKDAKSIQSLIQSRIPGRAHHRTTVRLRPRRGGLFAVYLRVETSTTIPKRIVDQMWLVRVLDSVTEGGK